MVFADSMTKAGRLNALVLLFCHADESGLSTAEIARRLGAAPRTVRKYLGELSSSGQLPIYSDGRRWKLVAGAQIEVPPVRFLLEEATAVYLAARLLVRHSDEPNPAVRGAVSKLAAVVPEDLRHAMGALQEQITTGEDAVFGATFRTVAYGWALRREVSLTYRSLTSTRPSVYRFRPYLMEPSAFGSALYAIGRADPPGAVRVFKLERAVAATLTDTPFTPPPARELLDSVGRAWIVWQGDGEPEEVRLRFTAAMARRVRETRWHPSQRLVELIDGGVELHVAVTSTVEILPWVLGWGAACEVLAPEQLRAAVARELAAAAARYEPEPALA